MTRKKFRTSEKAAIALKNVLDLKENKVVFNNETYLEREDWGTAGRFFDCTAKSIETRYVEFPEGTAARQEDSKLSQSLST